MTYKYIYLKLIWIFILVVSIPDYVIGQDWKANWITARTAQNATNTWMAFNKNVTIDSEVNLVEARIAADSKYWLWINDSLVVFEGALKRGPTPEDTYFDKVEIGPYLKAGENKITILLWYFGKDGFSHNSSGQSGFIFDCQTQGLEILSDHTWRGTILNSFENTSGTNPNYRLPESNIRYNASIGKMNLQKGYFESKPETWSGVRVYGKPPSAPWNNLIERPIPMFKNFGLKDYEKVVSIEGDLFDTLICILPYNAQVTPYMKINSTSQQGIDIRTDEYYGGSVPNVRCEYVTSEGIQEYENPGWMNGHQVIYVLPNDVEVIDLKYRETGYDCAFSGSFQCNDPFYNKLWEKSARTLYLTMRDTYMDCPDRERAQWWGDVVNESGEAFYALSPEAHLLTKKAILELINWQRPDSIIFSPIPTGIPRNELPGQMLASIGYYGVWNYYLNTGDKETLKQVYHGIGKYLDIWKLQTNGILVDRKGGWYWGDWGEQIDKQLLYNAWFYLALKGYLNISQVLGEEQMVILIEERMERFKKSFNHEFWDNTGYRTDNYDGTYDDRAQALAVVSGLASGEKYNELLKIFKNSFLASPYMEKYVLEALCVMGEEGYALERMKLRFEEMVNHPKYTTLWEGWGIGKEGFGGGTINHAWSGGGLTILSQYIAGISPLEEGFKKFKVRPRFAGLTEINAKVPTVSGLIEIAGKQTNDKLELEISVPSGTSCILYLPEMCRDIVVNNRKIDPGKSTNQKASLEQSREGDQVINLQAGHYLIQTKKRN